MLGLFSSVFRRLFPFSVRALKQPEEADKTVDRFTSSISPVISDQYGESLQLERQRRARQLVILIASNMPESVDRVVMTLLYDDGAELRADCSRNSHV